LISTITWSSTIRSAWNPAAIRIPSDHWYGLLAGGAAPASAGFSAFEAWREILCLIYADQRQTPPDQRVLTALIQKLTAES
jgi:hypothetical protein